MTSSDGDADGLVCGGMPGKDQQGQIGMNETIATETLTRV
jgi:hypothetical protein